MRRRLLVLLVSVAFGLAARPPLVRADGDLAALVRQLGGEDYTQRSAALTQLQTAKDPRAVPLLLAALDDFDLTARYYVVIVLGVYPEKEVRDAWRTLARSDDPYLRLCSGTWDLQHGDSRERAQALERIEKALATEGVETSARLYMVNKLIGERYERIRAALRGRLAVEPDKNVLGAILWALSMQDDHDAVPDVERLLERDDLDVQVLAASWLYAMGQSERAVLLAERIAAGDVETSTFSRMRSFLGRAGQIDPVVLDALMALLDPARRPAGAPEPPSFVLRQAVELLAQAHHQPALAVIRRYLDHSDTFLSKAVFDALIELSGSADATLLRPLLESPDADRRLQAAEALRRMDDASGLPAAIEILAGPDTALLRSQATRLVGSYCRAECVEPLLGALSDGDLAVRTAAQSALGALLACLFPYRRFDLTAAGYVAGGPEANRATALAKIRAWWTSHATADW